MSSLLEQGDLTVLEEPVADLLLLSKQLVRMASTWRDGTPRAAAIWFHWAASR